MGPEGSGRLVESSLRPHMSYASCVGQGAAEPSTPSRPFVVLGSARRALGSSRASRCLDRLTSSYLRPVTVSFRGEGTNPESRSGGGDVVPRRRRFSGRRTRSAGSVVRRSTAPPTSGRWTSGPSSAGVSGRLARGESRPRQAAPRPMWVMRVRVECLYEPPGLHGYFGTRGL
jgi:hypothetical protein